MLVSRAEDTVTVWRAKLAHLIFQQRMKDFRAFVHDRAKPAEKDGKVVEGGGTNSAAKFRKSGST